MKRICINNRDELVMLYVDHIAYILADGNYTKIVYIGGMQIVLTLGISKVEKILLGSFENEQICPFVRLGRSLIISQQYLYNINIVKQTLSLSDGLKNCLTLRLPKQLLKSYKTQLTKTTIN